MLSEGIRALSGGQNAGSQGHHRPSKGESACHPSPSLPENTTSCESLSICHIRGCTGTWLLCGPILCHVLPCNLLVVFVICDAALLVLASPVNTVGDLSHLTLHAKGKLLCCDPVAVEYSIYSQCSSGMVIFSQQA